MLKIASECAARGVALAALPQEARLREIIGRESAVHFFRPLPPMPSGDALREDATGGHGLTSLESLETSLVENVKQWLKVSLLDV